MDVLFLIGCIIVGLFYLNCESQEEIDYFWEKLSQGGDPAAQQCGWLKDEFGV